MAETSGAGRNFQPMREINRLAIAWIVITTVGFQLWFALYWHVPKPNSELLPADLFECLFIAPLAVGQWGLIRRSIRVRHSTLWIPATMIGLWLGEHVGFVFWERYLSPWAGSNLIGDYMHYYFWQIYLPAGVILGSFQAPLFAPSPTRAVVWILASGLGLGAGAVIFSQLFDLLPTAFLGLTTIAVGQSTCGLCLGLATALCLPRVEVLSEPGRLG